MFKTRVFVTLSLRTKIRKHRFFCSHGKSSTNLQNEDPIKRTFRILKNDVEKPLARIQNYFRPANINKNKENNKQPEYDNFQTHCDVLVIGGGAMGSSTAFWLKTKARSGLNVVVIEKDPSYETASTTLSVGGMRQQFSVEENVQMSLYGADFLRNINKYLSFDTKVKFYPCGYLLLASEQGSDVLLENSRMQNDLGAKNEIMITKRIKQRFPWINTKDIALGCHGLEKEGWFDPWSLLSALKSESLRLGAHFVTAEVIDFSHQEQPSLIRSTANAIENRPLNKVIIKLKDGSLRTIEFAVCVIAAGAESGKISRLASIGINKGLLATPLPVEPRKRFVYCFNCQNDINLGLKVPLTIDPSGTYFRRDGLGGNYIGGRSPSIFNEPSCANLDVDYNYFENNVWPYLANRVPSFESLKLKSAWAGFYDQNLFDENGIIGPHPHYNNLFFATGFSGHGIQQAPAVGRAISELIIEGRYRTIDLTRFGFDRLILQKQLFEANIV